MEKILPNQLAARYGVNIYVLADILGMPHDTLYRRNFRNIYFKQHELEWIAKRIKPTNKNGE